MGKRILVSSLCLLLFVLFCAALVSAANVTVNINSPANDTYLSGTVVINVTFSGQLVNITNFTLGVTNGAGTFFALTNNRSMFGNNYTEVLFSWETDNGTFTDGSGYTLNVTVNSTNISGSFFPGSESGNFNFSTFGGEYLIDNTVPNASAQFKDTAGNIKTKFPYGSKINIDCQTFDQDAGLNTTRNSVRVKFPSLATFHNITITKNSNSTLTAELEATKTREVGDYIVECVVIDRLGNENLTNRTLTIERNIDSGSSAFVVPGFEAPVGKVKIKGGVTSDAGRLTVEGTSRLMLKGATVRFDVKGEDHMITVKSVDENSVTLTIKSTPFDVTLAKGESKAVDVNDDGTADMEITYHKVFPPSGNYADLTFALTDKPAEKPMDDEPEREMPEGDEMQKEEYATPKSGMAVTIAVIIIILIIGYALIKGKKK